MAGSSIVGILKVLLTADTAAYERAMKAAQGSAKAWSTDLTSMGRQATAVGSALTRTITVPLLGVGLASIKAASDFESSFAGVRKTVNATEPEFAALAQGLRDMAKEIPVNVNELNKVAESAGQLGIKKEDILQFTRTMADLGVTTNLTADEAATATAQIQNIFGAAGKDVDRFGATLVALGNAGASTEKDIIEMGKRIAGAGNQVGLSQAQVLSFASALSSVGINAEAGGSAISRVFLKINDAMAKGGAGLNEFARIAGMTGPAFKKAFETDAAGATTEFIAGLKRLKDAGENVNVTIEGVVGKNIILKDTLMRASGAGDLLRESLALGNKAWQENTALVKEAEQRYKTLESQLIVLWNQIRDVGITLGTSLIPTLKDLIAVALPLVGMIGKAAEMFSALPAPIRLTVVGLAGVVAAVGPLLWVFGQLITAAGTVVGAFAAKGIAMRALTTVGRPLVAAMGAVATSFAAIGALAVVGVAALYQVGQAFVDLYRHWRAGKPMWDFFSARDEDNFVRRWLGLSTGIKATDIALAGAAESAAEFVGPLQQSTAAAATLKTGVEALSKSETKRGKDAMAALKELSALEGKIVEENAEFRAKAIAGIEAEKKAWREYYNWLGERRMENDATTMLPIASTMDLSKMFAPLKDTRFITQNLPKSQQWAQAWDAMKEGLSQTLGDIPQTLANAFTGGGDIMGAIKAIVSQIGSAVGGAIGFAVGGPLGQKIGAAIGSMSGMLVEPFKKLFGIGINDEIKKFNREIDKSREKLIEKYGSLERIARIGKAVGVDLAGAWYHQGEAGKKAFEKISKEFELAIEKMGQDLERRVKDAEDQIATAKSEIKDFQSELDGLMGDARELGYIFDKDGKLVSVAFDKMESTAKEFGVEVSSLGKSFQAARLAADAGKIINAFDLLTKGGADAGTILFGMKDEISKLVQESFKFGTTIPANMKPWIQNLIDTGQLLDADGKKITDIGKIKFGEPVKTQFEEISTKIGDLITKIGLLIDKLTNELIPALDAATRDRNVHIGITTDPIPDIPGDVGGQPDEPPPFATGTLGRLGKWFGNFPRTGMAAVLHGAEAVITPGQAPAFAMDVLGSNAAFSQGAQQRQSAPQPVIVRNVTDNRIFLDGHELKNWIKEQIVTAIDNNEGGFRSRTRDALGVTT